MQFFELVDDTGGQNDQVRGRGGGRSADGEEVVLARMMMVRMSTSTRKKERINEKEDERSARRGAARVGPGISRSSTAAAETKDPGGLRWCVAQAFEHLLLHRTSCVRGRRYREQTRHTTLIRWKGKLQDHCMEATSRERERPLLVVVAESRPQSNLDLCGKRCRRVTEFRRPESLLYGVRLLTGFLVGTPWRLDRYTNSWCICFSSPTCRRTGGQEGQEGPYVVVVKRGRARVLKRPSNKLEPQRLQREPASSFRTLPPLRASKTGWMSPGWTALNR